MTLKNVSDGDLFSTVPGMRVYSFTEMELRHKWLLGKFAKFTELNF